MSEEFRRIVATSPELQARWHTMTDRLAAKVREDFGVEVPKEELAQVLCVRLAVLSGDEDLLTTFDAEIQRHPGVAQAAKERELVRILADQKDPAHDHARNEWNRLSPHEKIRRARQIEAAQPKTAKPKILSVEEQAAAIKMVSQLRGGDRIAMARKLGLS
ncbi:hypothetical protein EF888_06540 [Silicimonas algicola]|uniref:Uncharacterized protein n=1 Tax=Silicimonas algicola TaxID=1826607 RepID=A0A316G375_9RHOB|nr:hypothetical protein [Silicimonas algicola]AZQ66827.1 hypothetical protein EF888_06540 [Silicimonas algicola]PWK55268.1 hypothetical protein C8D95_108147 [Silicimonas algicola]